MTSPKDTLTPKDFEAGLKTLEENLRGGPIPPAKRKLFRAELRGVTPGVWKRTIAHCIRTMAWIPTPEQIGDAVAAVKEEEAYRSEAESQDRKREEARLAAMPWNPPPKDVLEKFPNVFKRGGLLRGMDDPAQADASGPVVDIGLTPAQVQMRCDENLRMLERMAEEERMNKANK